MKLELMYKGLGVRGIELNQIVQWEIYLPKIGWVVMDKYTPTHYPMTAMDINHVHQMSKETINAVNKHFA